MTYSGALKPVMLGLLIFAAGCGARLDPLFGPQLNAADRAIAGARQKGADRNCPEKFQGLVKLRDDAEKTYLACKYHEARGMTQQVVSQANALNCPPQVAAAPMPAPAPAPAPAVEDSDGDGVPDSRDQCPGTPKGAKVDARGCWVLSGLLFDTDKSDIKPQYVQILDEAAEVLRNNPGVRLEIQGHADSRASDAYNQRLSERRANAVKAYFESKGIAASRLTAVGFGESKPVAPNTTPEGMTQNRRVELNPLY